MTTEMEIESLFARAEAAEMMEVEDVEESVEIDGQSGTLMVQRAGGAKGRLIPVYSSIDGCPSFILPHMIPTVMLQKNPDGSPMFLRRPRVQYRIGTIKCLLNPGHPSREEFNGMGLSGVTCPKATLRSEYDLARHMETVHPDENKLIGRVRAERREEEEREFRKAQMAIMQMQMDAHKAPEPPPAPLIPCKFGCGKGYETKSAVGMHERRHCPLRPADAVVTTSDPEEEPNTIVSGFVTVDDFEQAANEAQEEDDDGA